jgi:hypothetical protein
MVALLNGGAIMDRVKCAECGFLAIRNLETRELVEVEADFRKFGHPIGVMRAYPATQIDGTSFYEQDKYFSYIHDEIPICFKRIYDFMFWVAKYKDEKKIATDQGVCAILDEERVCSEFTQWKQGFTPKEHQEMIDRQERLKWQAEREDADRKWRESQESRRSKEEWKRYIFLAGVTIGAVILGFLLGHFIN